MEVLKTHGLKIHKYYCGGLTKDKKLKKQFFILKIVSKMYKISDVAVLHKHL